MATKQFYNPTTGASISVSEEEAKTFQGGTATDPYGGLLRSGFVEGTAPAPKSTLPGLTGSTVNPVSSTDGIRNEETANRNMATGILGGLDTLNQAVLDQKSFYQTQESVDALNELNRLRREFNVLNDNESAQVASAGAAAGAKIAPLIAQAEEEKRLGMPKALVEAGQRGGLMSSQFAGVAAGAPIVGESFVGAGGKLEQIKSAYDRNISNLRIQQQAAIAEAEAAARKAIRTGKVDDYTMLERAYDRAKTAYDEGNKLIREKMETITRVKEFQMKGIEFGQKQEDRAIESAVGTFVTLDENGDIVRPDNETLKNFAINNGLDPLRFATGINKKVDELEKLGREQRKAALDELNTKASIAATNALTEQRRLDAIKSEQMLPLEVQEKQAQIRKLGAETAKALADATSNTGYGVNDMLEGYANYFGKHYGSDAKLDTQVYLEARNEFVQQFKTNKEFYDKLFLRNFPPSVLLNDAPVGDVRHDPRAWAIIDEAKKANATPIISFSTGE